MTKKKTDQKNSKTTKSNTKSQTKQPKSKKVKTQAPKVASIPEPQKPKATIWEKIKNWFK